MEKDNKPRTTITLDLDILEDSRTNPHIRSLSSFFNEIYRETFMTLDSEKEKLKALEYKVKLSKQKIKGLEKLGNITLYKVPDQLWHWFKTDGIRIMQKDNIDERAVLRRINSQFKYNLTLKQFRYLIEKAIKEKEAKTNGNRN